MTAAEKITLAYFGVMLLIVVVIMILASDRSPR